MQLSLSGPLWKPKNEYSLVSRDGSMFLEFAVPNEAAAGGNYNDERTFNWGSKMIIALRPVELGLFLDQPTLTKGFEIYHDPSKGGAVSPFFSFCLNSFNTWKHMQSPSGGAMREGDDPFRNGLPSSILSPLN